MLKISKPMKICFQIALLKLYVYKRLYHVILWREMTCSLGGKIITIEMKWVYYEYVVSEHELDPTT